MSTRCTVSETRYESTGLGFHLHEDLLDDGDCVMLELEGMTFETSISFAPSGRPKMRVEVRIPGLWRAGWGFCPERIWNWISGFSGVRTNSVNTSS